jgi:hypothetical protein
MATALDCLRYEELRDAQKFQFCTRLNPIKLIAKVGDDDKLAANLPRRRCDGLILEETPTKFGLL